MSRRLSALLFIAPIPAVSRQSRRCFRRGEGFGALYKRRIYTLRTECVYYIVYSGILEILEQLTKCPSVPS